MGKSFASYTAYLEHRYLNGGSLRADTKAMFTTTSRLLNKAKIVQNLSKAQELCDAHYRTVKNDTIDSETKFAIYHALTDLYEPIVDDANNLQCI